MRIAVACGLAAYFISVHAHAIGGGVCPGVGVATAPKPNLDCNTTLNLTPKFVTPNVETCPQGSTTGFLPDGTADCDQLTHLGHRLYLPKDSLCPADAHDAGLAQGFRVCQVNILTVTPPLCRKGQIPIIDYQGAVRCTDSRLVPISRVFRMDDGCPIATRLGTSDAGAPECIQQ